MLRSDTEWTSVLRCYGRLKIASVDEISRNQGRLINKREEQDCQIKWGATVWEKYPLNPKWQMMGYEPD